MKESSRAFAKLKTCSKQEKNSFKTYFDVQYYFKTIFNDNLNVFSKKTQV